MAFPDCKLIVQSMRWCDSPPTRRVGHRPRVVSGDSQPTRCVGRLTAHASCRQVGRLISRGSRSLVALRHPSRRVALSKAVGAPRPSRHGHPCMQELTTAPAPLPHRCTSPTSTLALRSHQSPAACWALHSDSSHQSLSAARRLTRRTRRSLRRRSRPPLPALPAIALRCRFVAT